MLTSFLFRRFYSLKSQEEFYFFQSKGTPIIRDLPESNKGWKKHFVSISNPNEFKVNLEWRVANANGNRVPGVSASERADLDKIWGQ